MKIFYHILILVITCSVGGLLVVAIIFNKYRQIDSLQNTHQRNSIFLRDNQHFKTVLKQWFFTTGLLFSHEQTYLSNGNKAQAKELIETLVQIRDTVQGFEGVAKAIRYQSLTFQGNSTSDSLKGKDIPEMSRIIAIVNGYNETVVTPYSPSKLDEAKGRERLLRDSGKLFDPELVSAFLDFLVKRKADISFSNNVDVSVSHLKEGMVLSQGLKGTNDVLLLKKGTRLTGSLIKRIRSFGNGAIYLNGVRVSLELDP